VQIKWKDLIKVPNLLSLYRLILGLIFPLLWKLKIQTQILLILIGTAILSDTIDGNIARILHQKTDLGKILDPIADKVFINMLFILLYLNKNISLNFLLIILIRDLAILSGAIILYFKYPNQINFRPTYLGKTCTVFQLIFLFLYFIHLFVKPINQFLISIFTQLVIFFTLFSGFHYTFLFWKSFIKSPIR